MAASAIVLRHLAAALLVLLPLAVFAGSTQSFTLAAGSHPGSRDRIYKVYVPDGLSGPAPMLMALHGCQQTHDDVLRDWGLVAAADRHGFVLVAPFITSYDGLRNTNCWGFWFDVHRREGSGEVEDLHRIAVRVESDFAIDPARRYITGLSSGGAMAVVAAVAHNEYWAAAASASGLPFGESAASVSLSGRCPGSASFRPVPQIAAAMRAELDDTYPIPLMVLQNDRDCTVVQPAGRNLRDAHLAVFGDAGHDTATEALAAQRACSPVFQVDHGCEHRIYTGDGTAASRSIVETVFFSGPLNTPDPSDTDHGHYWIGGEHGRDGRWAIRRGPSYPDIAWDFFVRHPRDGTGPGAPPPPGAPRISLIGPDPLELELGEEFVDPGATATDAEDGELPVTADCSSVDTGSTGRYSCVYRATDSDGNTSTATRAVVVLPSRPTGPLCTIETASPLAHILAGRAVVGARFGLRALARDDGVDIGFAWDTWSRVRLYEGEPGRWYGREPQGCRT
ncbi:MAG: PHB depolymerase family esterase [Limnobacter sp.]|nr:PHB depolymerase family esterase [Limnobacter sp.]